MRNVLNKLPSTQTPPEHLRSAGRDLWSATLAAWSLTDAELRTLQTACECCDRLQDIREAIDTDGACITDPSGRQRAHPLIASESATQGVLLRAWAMLGLSDEEKPKIGRPPTRV